MADFNFVRVSGTVNGTAEDDQILVRFSDNATIDGGNGDDTITVLHGKKVLIGGFGDDTLSGPIDDGIYNGDTGDLTVHIQLPPLIERFGVEHPIFGLAFTLPSTMTILGDDEINGGHHQDLIYGDTGLFELFIEFHSAQANAGETESLFFNFNQQFQFYGKDMIFGNGGNDTLFGDADAANIFAEPGTPEGASSFANGAGAQSTAIFWTTENNFVFGEDLISGGAGNDIIHGDSSAQHTDTGAGLAEATNGGNALVRFLTAVDLIEYSSDHILGGNGNDTIYGVGEFLTLVTSGGTAIADGQGSVASTIGRVGPVAALGFLDPVSSFMKGDHIEGGNGDDTIYGDVKVYTNTLNGGSATATNGGHAESAFVIDGTIVQFGSDEIEGNKGDDFIVGDTLVSKLFVNEGITVVDENPESFALVSANFVNFTRNMGDDNIDGGKGTDTLIGDVLDYGLLDNALDVTLVDGHIVVSDSFNNNIKFGNDVLSGGEGKDNFVTTLIFSATAKLTAQGFDLITDFSTSQDTLTFIGISDLSELSDNSLLLHNNGDTIIEFNGGGSLTLTNTDISSLVELKIDFFPDPSSFLNSLGM